MDEDPSTNANVFKLRQYFRKTSHNRREANDVCELLRTSNINLKRDGLSLIRAYLKNSTVANTGILETMASCGYFNLQDSILQTPLHWIIAKDKFRKAFGITAVEAIIKGGSNPALADSEGDNVLHLALVTNMDYEFISALLEGQPSASPLVTSRNKKGWTPMMLLMARSVNWDAKITRLLLQFGGEINGSDEFGGTLLHYLFSNVNYEKSPKFIQRIQDSRLFEPPPFCDFEKVVKFLVDRGANVNLKNNANHVPLWLAISNAKVPFHGWDELTIRAAKVPLSALKKIIPSVDILNDNSLWNGPVIDFVLKSKLEPFERDEIAKSIIKAGANQVTNATLKLAMDNRNCSTSIVELLVNQLECRSTFKDFESVAKSKRVHLYEPLLQHGDENMITMIKSSFPYILIEISEFYIATAGSDSVLKNLIETLVNNYGVDVNYKKVKGTQATLLHALLEYSFSSGELSSLDSILNMDSLKINETIKVKHKQTDGQALRKNMSALDYALHLGHYKAAELLIRNFADMTQLAPIILRNKDGFAQCLKMLSVLGHKFNFEEMKATADRYVLQELKYVENFVAKRSKRVLTLKEISVLQVRRHASKQDLAQLLKDIEIPEDIQDILYLKDIECDFVRAEEIDESSDEGDVVYVGLFHVDQQNIVIVDDD